MSRSVVEDIASDGSVTFFAAIATMPAGIQVAMLAVLMALGLSVSLNIYLLRRNDRVHEMSRADGIATRDVLEQTNIALAVISSRLK